LATPQAAHSGSHGLAGVSVASSQSPDEGLLDRDRSGNWRVIFRLADGYAEDVDYFDYH
jgi:hypothetical protein